LATHGRILTNFRRSKWGGGISPTCPCCGNEDETILHVLRDCINAIQVWLYIVPSDFITNFFSFDCRDWFFNNLNKKDIGTNTLSWKTTFMTTCWYLWKWRNKTIFEADFIRPNNPISLIWRFVQDIEDCNLELVRKGPKLNEIIYIGWKRPQEGWIKLNSDGACKDMGVIAGCGGLFRDSDGRWIKGYTKKIGACDALHAEMWGLYLGLDMAWREHYSHLIVESDSKILIDMISDNFKFNGNIPVLVHRIRKLLKMSWNVQLNHTWREGNRSADWLANLSISTDHFNFLVLESPPCEVKRILFDDLSGACMPRNVRLAS
jgi:ribonuclease HI